MSNIFANIFDSESTFKVSMSQFSVRQGFLRKVYAILACQLLLTFLTSFYIHASNYAQYFVLSNPGVLNFQILLGFASLIGLFFKRHQYPMNLILLATMTFSKAYLIGAMTLFYDVDVVLQAVFLTAATFLALTLYTFQTKRDFGTWAQYLYTGLWVLLLGGVAQIFFTSGPVEIGLSIFGAFFFAAYVIYDTQNIMKKVSPEEYILAALTLYLDIINLFLHILKVLNAVKGGAGGDDEQGGRKKEGRGKDKRR